MQSVGRGTINAQNADKRVSAGTMAVPDGTTGNAGIRGSDAIASGFSNGVAPGDVDLELFSVERGLFWQPVCRQGCTAPVAS